MAAPGAGRSISTRTASCIRTGAANRRPRTAPKLSSSKGGHCPPFNSLCEDGVIGMKTLLAFALFMSAAAQNPASPPPPTAPAPDSRLDRVLKEVDDLMWNLKAGDIAEVDKIEYTSAPPAKATNPKLPGAVNPLIIRAYTFIPKDLDRGKKQPLIVFAHQGIHANFDTRDLHVIRELIQQGYSIIAPDYRGSTGYGREFYEQIDYGGLEVDDVYNATL